MPVPTFGAVFGGDYAKEEAHGFNLSFNLWICR